MPDEEGEMKDAEGVGVNMLADQPFVRQCPPMKRRAHVRASDLACARACVCVCAVSCAVSKGGGRPTMG